MNKRVILPTLLLSGALAVGSLGFAKVYAQENTEYPPIVIKLAERFGLNASDVQNVFQEVNDEHEADRQARFAEYLDDLVSDGKLTETQKQTILDKHEEMESRMEEFKDLDPEQRREKMQQYHEELKKWATENGIEFPFMMFKTGFHKGLRTGHFMEKLD